jgi:hypothetical protein
VASSTFSHWDHLVEGSDATPMEFYRALEEAIERRKVPNSSRSRVDYREGGLLSAKREYLRVKRLSYTFDICGAPFGTGFFVSWWLSEQLGCLSGLAELPFVSRLFGRETFYKIDTALMFQDAVHNAVLEVIEGMRSAKGIRALSELERKPVMRGLVR